MTRDVSRRTLLLGGGLAVAAGIAGCLGGGNAGGDDGGGDARTSTSPGTMSDSETTETTPDGETTETTPGTQTSRTTTDPGTSEGIETEPLPEHGDEQLLADVESFPSQGAEHVSATEEIEYDQMPPLSGPHYRRTVRAGFYTQRRTLGALVHTLEHGAVIVYFDPDAITDRARQSLRAFVEAHSDRWRPVLAVPHPEDDPESAYVLTAWRHRLAMDEYDPAVVRAFLAEYLGRGPENPVR